MTWVKARKSKLNAEGKQTFFVGVHHGGCQSVDNCGISENTPETSILATQLDGDYLEIDIHLTKDQVPVFFHLGLSPPVVQGIYCTGKVEDYTYAQLLANCRLRNGDAFVFASPAWARMPFAGKKKRLPRSDSIPNTIGQSFARASLAAWARG